MNLTRAQQALNEAVYDYVETNGRYDDRRTHLIVPHQELKELAQAYDRFAEVAAPKEEE